MSSTAKKNKHFVLDTSKIERALVPNLTDWSVTGTVLNQFGGRFGFEMVGKSPLTNDALIAMSAARHGLTIQTTNIGDFGKLAEIREFQWEAITVLLHAGSAGYTNLADSDESRQIPKADLVILASNPASDIRARADVRYSQALRDRCHAAESDRSRSVEPTNSFSSANEP